MAEDTRLWHGGAPGLRAGNLLLPPEETGVTTRVEYAAVHGILPAGWTDPSRPDRVYLTRNRELARAYACGSGWRHDTYGALYVARPIGPYQPDPDHLEHSIECERAEIVAVYDPVVVMKASRYRRIMLAQIR